MSYAHTYTIQSHDEQKLKLCIQIEKNDDYNNTTA